LSGCPQNPQWHPEGDVWNHTLAVADAAAILRTDDQDDALVFMLAALCHDFGKPLCTVTQSDGRITSCGHDTLTEPAEKFITSIWARKDLPERVIPLISRHMHPWQLTAENASDKAFRKLALHVKRLDLLASLAEADVRGIAMSRDELTSRLAKIDLFRKRCEKLAIADRIPEPLILGRHLIARNLMPGPDFSPILAECFEAQLAGKFSDLPGALKYLDELLCGK
jgi:tRNA nucleotidyltransferase (CCA-adding enzyme)